MKRSWPVHAFVVLCALFVPVAAPCQSTPLALEAATPDAAEIDASTETTTAYLPEDSNIPPNMLDAMRKAHLKYVEGSNLIKSGESDKARVAFNRAVDIVMQSDFDLASSTSLNIFFQDLIQRIQQDESRYLRPPDDSENKAESAVVDELEKLDLIPISIDPSLQDVVEQDLVNTKYDIPITLNDRVLKSLNFWLNRGRKFFISGLVRSGRYREMIEKTFREESIPLDIMYLAQAESLFKPNALSHAQARGIWQFGKWTAIRYGLKVNAYVDERSDPEKSTRAAAHYLNDLFAMFKDWNLVLAAYNWGEARIQQLIEKSGLNNFWDLADLRRKMPEETKNHVPLIMASIILAHSPERYGLPSGRDQPLAYDSISVSKAIDLRAAAKILDIPVEDLKELNPALRGYSTPADYPNYQLKVPSGTNSELGLKIAALPAVKFKPRPEFAARHKVRSGDTLQKIAGRYGVSLAALQRANNLNSSKSLRAGSWIRVPSQFPAISKSATGSRAAGRLPSHKPINSSIKRAGTKKSQPIKSASSNSKRPNTKVASAGQSKSKKSQSLRTASAKSANPAAKSSPKVIASR